jgi:Transposase
LELSRTSIHTTPCAFRQVRWSFPSTECLSCGGLAPRLWDATRVAVDIDLEQPVVLAVIVSVHICPVCGRMFRAQPPFLRPRAIYTLRVVQKAVAAVYCDGLAMRCVPDRLARDFWVKPDEKMVRLWCRAFAAEIDFVIDYQPWVVANFSGILCVDEVYQGDLALLLAVDPAAPDGDRLVGYTLLSNTREVDQSMVKAFLERLRAAGVDPAEVITDDSRLYPSVLAEVWPTAVHQLCLFHATRRVVRAVNDVVKQVRRSLPTPPPASGPSLLGRLRETPPTADQHDPDSERYRWRLARRKLGIAQAHALHQHLPSARAIGRQLGVNHGTVRQWLKLTPPDAAAIAELSGTTDVLPVVEPPPLPWRDWDEVRRVREDLWLYRTLFLHQTENLTTEERHKLAESLACPVGRELRVARTFLETWFAIWQDDSGQKRTPDEAEQRYRAWQADAEASTLAPLRRQQQHLDNDHFVRLSAFLRHPLWESTNNAAERGGRAFRHGQHPHFRLRLVRSIEADLKVRACLKKERFCSPPPTRLHRCQRGRR